MSNHRNKGNNILTFESAQKRKINNHGEDVEKFTEEESFIKEEFNYK